MSNTKKLIKKLFEDYSKYKFTLSVTYNNEKKYLLKSIMTDIVKSYCLLVNIDFELAEKLFNHCI